MSGDLSTFGEVVATQDRDCIDRLKFRYTLTRPLTPVIFEQFRDAEVTLRCFSALLPLGRDLFRIAKPLTFRVDGIMGDRKLIVAFNGSPRDWPKDIVDDFGRRLIALGYSAITYRRNEPPRCADCALRISKNCHGGEEHPR